MTPQEYRIAKMRIDGFTYREIGDRLGLKEKTVAAHMWNLYCELEVHNVAQLAKKLHGHLGNSLTKADFPQYEQDSDVT